MYFHCLLCMSLDIIITFQDEIFLPLGSNFFCETKSFYIRSQLQREFLYLEISQVYPTT